MSRSNLPLWQATPERRSKSQLSAFAEFLSRRTGRTFADYQSLHRYSVDDVAQFWGLVAEFSGIRWHKAADRNFQEPPAGKMLGGKWFPGAQISFAENLLPSADDSTTKIISIIEGLTAPKIYRGSQIFAAVARCASQLAALGVQAGDRVAGVLPNTVEAIVAMLATNAIGAVWASCSPDFGQDGILDRFSQIQPKVLFATAAYVYNGKTFDCRPVVEQVRKALPGLLATVLVDPAETHLTIAGPGCFRWEDFLAAGHTENFRPLPTAFDHPLYILFSSGTTGKPKCIVHGVGGSLLQHKKELMLHSDLGPGKRLLYFTTCGWMMWNWMVSALSTGAELVLFEGSVARDKCNVLWKALEDHKVHCFGTSARFIAASMKDDVHPGRDFDLSSLETILSTGSPLMPEQFTWIYEQVKKDVHLASICGGTDIVSCFMLGNPWMPVYSGEIQAAGLGMAVECWSEDGQPILDTKGELVCTKPFPSMPLGFWGDDEGRKYRESYFEYFEPREVWRHGDFIEINDEGGIIVYGRSDATLNPGGVRIGTAEIYRQVEQLEEVLDSLAVSHEKNGDAQMLLFVKLQPGIPLNDSLKKVISTGLRTHLSPRHVPAAIFHVTDIPYTRSGKKLELAVTRILNKDKIDNLTAIANPESLEDYRRIAEELG